MKKFIALFAFCAAMAASLYARDVTVSIGTGEGWKGPQLAVWLEDEQGRYIKTLYVTQKAGGLSWIFGPKEGRPESLPVWYHASKHDPKKSAAQNSSPDKKEIDAVTSATPKGGLVINQKIDDEPCVIKVEVNASFDYNSTWTKKNSGVNGQPSLVYQALLPAGQKEEVALELSGSGSIDGSDGSVHKDVVDIDSAKTIVKSINVVF
ncbi:MAG: DUF2271 domain-containing protein [Treponema sp.]|nr:DUF2271 domain-containing protein [Treponema sp.]